MIGLWGKMVDAVAGVLESIYTAATWTAEEEADYWAIVDELYA